MDKITTTKYDNTIKNSSDTKVNHNDIKFTIPNTKNTTSNLSDDKISFQDTQNMTLEELQAFYGSKETQQKIRNLYMATQFSSDLNLSLSLFNQVNSMSEEQSISYLASLFTHKNISLDTQTDSFQKGALLRKSIIEMIDDPDIKAQQEKLEKEFSTSMMQFDIMSHFNSMLNFGRSEKDKNKDSEYSFLYNNFYEQYNTLFSDYNNNKSVTDMLINQYKK